MSRWSHDFGRESRWSPYVSQAERRAKAARYAQELKQQGVDLDPVRIEGRIIATSCWGAAWCKNLEAYSDFANRLPRGRAYVRNGSVIHLGLATGAIDALVSGSEIYTVKAQVRPLARGRWKALVAECAGRVGSLVDLLQGRFERSVMEILTRREAGLFPSPRELEFACSCPDFAAMCKHVAAVFYGIGARFDRDPALFFTLRSVDGADLVVAAATAGALAEPAAPSDLAGEDLGAVFGIELDSGAAPAPAPEPTTSAKRKAGPSAKPRRAADDGFAAVFGPGLEVTAQFLTSFGIPRTTFCNWLASGALERTGERGVYQTTARTLARARSAYTRALARRR